MDINTTLRIAYAILAVSLVSLASVIAVMVFHLDMPAGLFKILSILGYIWPAAAYAIAILRKRRAQQG